MPEQTRQLAAILVICGLGWIPILISYFGRSTKVNYLRSTTALVLFIMVIGCTPSQDHSTEGFILKTGNGESLLNGIVVKASPQTGTMGSILVEQTFQLGGKTGLHLHDQGDELFYVVSGRGTATLDNSTAEIGFGDVIFVPAGAVHSIQNLNNNDPLVVVFFMDSPELVEEFRALHERVKSEPDRPITDEEKSAIRKRIGGSRSIDSSSN